MADYNYIAIDLGAESGRVMLATLKNEKIELQEMHRFANGPIKENGSLRWDFQRLINEIYAGMEKTLAVEKNIQSIGVDTWGVDYGLADEQGQLLENPYHYRDSRNDGMIEWACQKLSREQIYQHTGIQFLPFNTLYQLIACKRQRPELLARAKTLLFMPNLFMNYLCGDISAEYTIASTSQMMDMKTGQWSDVLLDGFGLPKDILPSIAQPGSQAGVLKKELAGKWNCGLIPIVSVGTHDTASAVAAVPASEQTKWAYLSSGTWSLMGIETSEPVINDVTSQLSFTNEGGVENTIRLLKNIMGLWLVQESRRYWAEQGHELDYAQITEMASQSRQFQARIDPDYGAFLSPGQMPEKINDFLRSTGQTEIDDKGQLIRVILESLAVRYRQIINTLEELSGDTIEVLHIVGGGCQNELLNQFTANATEKRVIAGPIEGTVLGNVLVQARAVGQIDSLEQGRKIISRSFALKEYESQEMTAWKKYAESFSQLKIME